jgi:hypothetical protein
MTSKIALTAALILGVTHVAAAQSAAPAERTTPASGVVAVVDVSRLPIDIRRIERGFRQTTIREQRNGLNLSYFVDVYAKAPEIRLFTPQDNLEYGPAPYGAPSHYEMLNMMTPPEFRGSTMMLRSGFGVPWKKSEQR